MCAFSYLRVVGQTEALVTTYRLRVREFFLGSTVADEQLCFLFSHLFSLSSYNHPAGFQEGSAFRIKAFAVISAYFRNCLAEAGHISRLFNFGH